MKIRTLLYPLSLLAAAMTMTACSSEIDESIAGTTSDDSPVTGTFQVSVDASADGAQTRALSVGGDTGNSLFTNWDSNDVVEVVKDGTTVGTLTPDLSSGNNSAYATLTGTLTGTFAVGDALKLCYIAKDFAYSGQDGTLAKVSSSYSYMSADVTVQEIGKASGNINDGSTKYLTLSDAAFAHEQAYLDLTFTDYGGSPIEVKKLEIWAEGNKVVNTISGGTRTYATEASPLVIERSSDKVSSKMFLALRDENGAANTYHFKATAEDGTIYTYEGSKNLTNGQFYTGTVAMTDGRGVDIGLYVGGKSSGKKLLWAKTNVGATTETDAGLYFAWGDITGRSGAVSSGTTAADGYSFNWTNYRYANGGWNKLTKYCNNSSYGNGGFTDELTTLVPSDDAATANWGGSWRMPTYDELNALLATKSDTENYSWEWMTNYKGSGANGYLITYKVIGNSIFLPAAGRRNNTDVDDVGEYGHYWLSSLNSYDPYYARNLRFYNGFALMGNYYNRYNGFTVRPVQGN